VSAGAFLTAAQKAELEAVAEAIGTPGKGITACDEGPGTIGMRFEEARAPLPSPPSLCNGGSTKLTSAARIQRSSPPEGGYWVPSRSLVTFGRVSLARSREVQALSENVCVVWW
jgi:hypothetical protein